MQFSVRTSPHWALRSMVAFVHADRASTLPGRVVDLEVCITGVHGVGVVGSCGLAADRARDGFLAEQSTVVGAVLREVAVKAAFEALL